MAESLKRFNGSSWEKVASVNRAAWVSGSIGLEDDEVYPTIINSGYIPTSTGSVTITSTAGNFLLAFFISRSETPVTSAPGWKVWGGYAPIRRSDVATQRVWVLTKQSTGTDSIEFTTGGAIANYIIWYEFAAAEINLSSPIYIGPAPVLGEVGISIPLSKCKDKLIIWAGHACYYNPNSSQPIWQTSTDLPLIAGHGDLSVVPNWMLGCLADTTKLSDWSANGYTGSAGIANMKYWHNVPGICSILPVAINHA